MRPFRSRRLGSAAATTRTVPKKLVSSWARASASGVVSTGPARPHPAHVTTASIRPRSRTTRSTAAATDASSSTSMTSEVHASSGVVRRLAPTTSKPRVARWTAQARPIPDDAPVMSTTFLSMRMSST